MALASMLSALREVILSTEVYPGSAPERHTLFRSRFPALSDDEIGDLARLDPAQVRIYTRSIFAGEGETLRNIFRLSMPHLLRQWREVEGREPTNYMLAAELHAARPWRSNLTSDLARNFVAFCVTERAALLERAPYLHDLLTLELLCQELRRAPDDDAPPIDEMLTALRSMTVGDLLDRSFFVRPCARFAVFEHDVVALHTHYFYGDGDGSEVPEVRPVFAAGGRNAELRPYWTSVGESVHGFLSTRDAEWRMEELAARIVEGAKPDHSEEQIFLEVLETISRLIRAGVIGYRATP